MALRAGLCFICGGKADLEVKGVELHRECILCPRCGSGTVIWDRETDPIWLRCIGCLHGWLRPAPPHLGLYKRDPKQLEHFPSYVDLKGG